MPALPDGAGCSFIELSRRYDGPAIVAVAAAVAMADGVVVDAWLGVGGAGPRPYKAVAAEAELRGHPPDPDRIEAAAGLAAAQSRPAGDSPVPAEYRRHLVGVLVRRALSASVRDVRPARDA
jgi:CO/xanthine dehydrogenase FAD-binding subunit